MNNNKDLIKEAIADAKAVREVALANAKLALQEAFEPKLKTIMSAHLEEELSEEDINEEGLDEMMYDEEEKQKESMEEEVDINALLAELEEGSDEDHEEEEKDHEEDENLEEAKEKEEDKKEEMSDDEEIEVGDMTKDDIIDLIRQEISAQLDGEEVEAEMGAEEMDDEMGADEMEADNMMMENEELEEGMSPDLMQALTQFAQEHGMSVKELIGQAAAVLGTVGGVGGAFFKAKQKFDQEHGKKLEEALGTINILKNELNEVNLLNAKLLYANKLFNKYSLSESQKLKVINSFDNAETVRETKLVFNTLNESFEAETKVAKQKTKSITEGLGMASKPSGVSKPAKQTLNESNEFVSRLQKLANIKL
jgi:hypothetical protein